jgi:8-oxo-dGTP diphosphatase
MSERPGFIPAVFTVVYDSSPTEGGLLLHLRQNTGFCDGLYDVASGHVEPGELPHLAAARELREETGLSAQPTDLELFHIMMAHEEGPLNPYTYMFFRVALAKCLGRITLEEPEKSADIGMFRRDALPPMVPHLERALALIGSSGVTFSRI